MDSHQAEASSSTAPPPTVHQATFVFDSGLSRERYTELIETNGVVHKLVQRLMEKSGGEASLRIGLIVTPHDAQYSNPRALHSTIPTYYQDFRRPSAFLTSLPSLIHRFSPRAALVRPKPGSLFSDIWDIEDGSGMSVTSNEPGPSDHFLSGLVGGLQLLEQSSLNTAVPPPSALKQMSPDSALPMLSMMYQHPANESRRKYLLVFTEKASLAAIDGDSRGSRPWARADSRADYDDVDWDTIGDRCKAKDVLCSCLILGSPETGKHALGKDGSASAEKLRKMCQVTTPDPPEDPWFTLPQETETFLTGFVIRVPPPVNSSPAIQATTTAADALKVPAAAPGATETSGMSEAQAKYQMAQKQAMSLKMAQAAQAARGGEGAQGGFNVLASLLSSGRLDPNIMAQLVANARSEDPTLRNKAMSQLSTLMSLQAKQGNANAAAGGNTGGNANPGQNASNLLQQQRVLAAMQARQQQQNAQNAAAQNNNAAANPQQPPQQQQQPTLQAPAPIVNQAQNQTQQTAPTSAPSASPSLTQQQQLLLQQQRQTQLAAQANLGIAPPMNAAQPNAAAGRANTQRVWTGTISWTMKAADNSPQKWVIPVDCTLLSAQLNASELQTNLWPENLEMTGMSQMNMSELQTYVKTHQAPCVLFTVSQNQNDASARSKMGYLTQTLGSKSLCALIRFGNQPGKGILLISSSPSGAADKVYRLLGVVCMKTPFIPSSMLNSAQGTMPQPTVPTPTNQTTPQQQNIRPAVQQMSINGQASQFQNTLTNISPSFLQQAHLLQQQQQQSSAANLQSVQAQALAQQRAASQPQAMNNTQNNVTQQRLASQPSTLQQFANANQSNAQTIQQLQLRQLQAQAQAGLSQANSQNATPTPQAPNQPQPNAAGQAGFGYTDSQKAGIRRLLAEAGVQLPPNFDVSTLPREQLAALVARAKQNAANNQAAVLAAMNNNNNVNQQQQQQQQQQPATNTTASIMGGFSNFMSAMQAQQAQQGQQGQLNQQGQQNPLQGLQLGQFSGLNNFNQQGGNVNGQLGLFAAAQAQGVNASAFQNNMFGQQQ